MLDKCNEIYEETGSKYGVVATVHQKHNPTGMRRLALSRAWNKLLRGGNPLIEQRGGHNRIFSEGMYLL